MRPSTATIVRLLLAIIVAAIVAERTGGSARAQAPMPPVVAGGPVASPEAPVPLGTPVAAAREPTDLPWSLEASAALATEARAEAELTRAIERERAEIARGGTLGLPILFLVSGVATYVLGSVLLFPVVIDDCSESECTQLTAIGLAAAAVGLGLATLGLVRMIDKLSARRPHYERIQQYALALADLQRRRAESAGRSALGAGVIGGHAATWTLRFSF